MDRPDRLDVEVKVLKKKYGIRNCTICVEENTPYEDKTSIAYTNLITALRLKVGNIYFLHIDADNKILVVTNEAVLKE